MTDADRLSPRAGSATTSKPVHVRCHAVRSHVVVTPRRTTFILGAGTALVFVLALTVVPMHVTLGAGSLQCGTVISPDTDSEIGALCPDARRSHLNSSLGVVAVLAAIAAFPWVAAALGAGRGTRVLLGGWALMWCISAALGLAWLGFFAEYSPPHEVFDL